MKVCLNGKYSEQWKNSAAAEYKILMQNKTWELVDLPNDGKKHNWK